MTDKPSFDEILEKRAVEASLTFDKAALYELMKDLGFPTNVLKVVRKAPYFSMEWFNNEFSTVFDTIVRGTKLRKTITLTQLFKNYKRVSFWDAYLDLLQEGASWNCNVALIFNVPDFGKWVAFDHSYIIDKFLTAGPGFVKLDSDGSNHPLIIQRMPVFASVLASHANLLDRVTNSFERLVMAVKNDSITDTGEIHS